MAEDGDALELAARLRATMSRLRRRLREQGRVGDLTPSQVAVLLRLEREGPATASQLARAEGLRSQSMGTVVNALEAAGLVAGTPDPADRRQIMFSLTPSCVARLAQSRAAHQDWLSAQIRRLSSEEQAGLAAALATIEQISGS